MIVHIENPKESTKQLLGLISELSRVTQSSVYLYIPAANNQNMKFLKSFIHNSIKSIK